MHFIMVFAYESRASSEQIIEVIEHGFCGSIYFTLPHCTALRCVYANHLDEHRGILPLLLSMNIATNRVLCQFWFIIPLQYCRYIAVHYYCLRILSTKLNPILDLSTNQNAWSIALNKKKKKTIVYTENEIGALIRLLVVRCAHTYSTNACDAMD